MWFSRLATYHLKARGVERIRWSVAEMNRNSAIIGAMGRLYTVWSVGSRCWVTALYFRNELVMGNV